MVLTQLLSSPRAPSPPVGHGPWTSAPNRGMQLSCFESRSSCVVKSKEIIQPLASALAVVVLSYDVQVVGRGISVGNMHQIHKTPYYYLAVVSFVPLFMRLIAMVEVLFRRNNIKPFSQYQCPTSDILSTVTRYHSCPSTCFRSANSVWPFGSSCAVHGGQSTILSHALAA